MEKRFHVLITDRFDINALALLQGRSDLLIQKSADASPSAEELKNAQALIIRSRTKITEELLKNAPQLKCVITATSGFDHIDFDATQKFGIQVMHTPEANAASACELTWALVLACARKIPEAHRAVKSGDWRRDALNGRELSGKTYGVIGLGRIGTRVARVAQAFGMRTIAFDPYQEDEYFEKENVLRVSLEEVLKMADVISVHVPATLETHHMLKAATLIYINKGLIFVNTSRGSVISEADLCDALEKGWIGACGLDVFEKEPLPRHSGLLNHNNLILSPHIGATTAEAFSAASQEAAEKLLAFVSSGAVSDELPPRASWYQMGFTHPGPAPTE